ncbi:MAG: FAD-binding oxidoreductase [Rhodospirillales bacterium]|nr:FAD-binding oxidoreductase [Rhodospirillales bacterium]MCB9997105.1 FAD-binding oxidoreductase [Rhodospirillales bacterium]
MPKLKSDSSYIDSYYSRSLADDAVYPVLEGTVKADVCVIGGGFAGLACALGLAERGKAVVLLEAQRVGYGASGRNGGFCMGGYALGNEDAAPLVKKVGMDHAKALYKLSMDGLNLVRRRIEALNIPCDPVDGQVIAAWHPQAEEQQHIIEYMATHFGRQYEFWPQEKVRDLYRTTQYHDAIYLPDQFHIHSLRYARGLAQAICAKGGQVYEGSAAVSVDDKTAAKRVRTLTGTVEADHIVYCGSAYFNGIEKKLSRACLPVATYVMVTEPLSEEKMRSAIRVPHAIHDTRFAYDYYRPLKDGRILWGGRVAYKKTPAHLAEEMRGDMLTIYPQLADVKIEVAWSGLMGYTVHKMPLIGSLSSGVWSCTNFGGNGVAGPTTAGGEVIARAIAEGDETYKLFEPFGFDYTAGPLGPLVAQAVYRGWEFKDWLAELGRKH